MPRHACFLLVLLLASLVSSNATASPGLSADNASEVDEILLVVSTPYEGTLRDYGLPTLQAVRLVVEDYNAAGGLLGRPIRLLPFNDECQPGKIGELLQLMNEANATLMIGPICNGMAREVLPMLNRQGVVGISPSVTEPELTQSGLYPLFFRTMWPEDAQPEKQVAFLKGKDFKRLVLLHDESEEDADLTALTRSLIESDPALVLISETDLAGGEEVAPAMRTILEENADAVIYRGRRGLGSAMLSLLRAKGFEGAFIGDDRFWDETLLTKLGDFGEGIYFTGPVDLSENPLYGLALERFATDEAAPARPGPYFHSAYAAALALLHAVEQAESTEPDKVAAMLRQHTVDTPLGKISFDEAGDVTGPGMVVYQFKNGEIREVFR